jgi:hypothetical protein
MRLPAPRLGAWCRRNRCEHSPAHQRRLSARYRGKQRVVRHLWLSSALLILLRPELPLALILGLLTTFVSFAILDETPDT